MQVDLEFGHWLAGFIDGEGHFAVYDERTRASRKCLFEMGLRSDDAAILDEIARRTGLGRVYTKVSSGRPCTTWRVSRKSECLELVALLDLYPLRAKKARDYVIWRQAVFAWERMDFPAMTAAHDAIRAGRAYNATAAPFVTQSAQMELL